MLMYITERSAVLDLCLLRISFKTYYLSRDQTLKIYTLGNCMYHLLYNVFNS